MKSSLSQTPCAMPMVEVRYYHYIKTRVKFRVGKQHIIELNGKRYDAVTGKMITVSPASHSQAKTTAKAAKKASIDGFARAVKSPATGNPVPAHKTEKSKTLMRKTVGKPATPKTTAVAGVQPKIELAASSLSAQTLAHARAIKKSSLVRRFSDMAPSKAAPAAKPQTTARLQAVATATTVEANPLSTGLENATSHEQPRTKRDRAHVRLAKRLKVSPRILSTGSLVLAGLLIGGFFAYQNIPNLNMRLAAAKSGVHGSLPSYHPSGFGLHGGISYKPGQIEISYKSHSDNRNFKITQSTSSWNSDTLVENYDALKTTPPITVPNKGKTVYIYDGSNATWVDGGIWYRVEGNSQLNSDQLLNLANSM